MRQKLLSFAAALAVIFSPFISVPQAVAATTASHAANFNNKSAMNIAMTKGVAGVSFGDVTAATASSQLDAVNLDVDSNSAWQVQVKSSGANFTSGANNIPVSRLGWRLNGGGGYTNMTITDAQVTAGSAPGSATDIKVDYELLLQYGDAVADNYTQNIVYTVAAN